MRKPQETTEMTCIAPFRSIKYVTNWYFALQLFWEKRLQGLSASDVTEQIIKTMELPKGLQGNI